MAAHFCQSHAKKFQHLKNPFKIPTRGNVLPTMEIVPRQKKPPEVYKVWGNCLFMTRNSAAVADEHLVVLGWRPDEAVLPIQ
ncbi:hypothetical protein NIES970_29160 (plasmid) [[Synechococcus] sp. NIES-970]|nr:hypothetical protein NIES970_29160 [[Synechococcus] sp. NIES-970]